MMRNGRNNMPPMNRIDEHDRWHIVNYVRGLQGKLAPDIVVRTIAPGLPGMTGETLPGPTQVAPNRPAPFAKPVYVPTPGAPGAGTQNREKRP